jgi:hypothetical protein
MFKKKDATRLGEILVSKGLITPEQLAIATHEQTKRNRLLNVTDTKAPTTVMIGEILVEFGFIDQLELNRGLNWQQRLRHVSIAMALCAPFMVFAPSSATAQTTTSSSSSSVSSTKSFTPTTIQAEEYSLMSGVQIGSTTDTGTEKYVGYIDTNDWISYTNKSIYIQSAGNYKMVFRVASMNGGGIIDLREASTEAIIDSFNVPKTNGWHTWTDVVRTVFLTQGTHTFKLFAKSGGFNLNWFKVDWSPTPMPLTIQAESYSSMSGVLVQPTSDAGGGTNVGSLEASDWIAYNNTDVVIPTAGTYKITYRVASLNGGGKFTLNESIDQSVIDTVSVPKTSGWQSWVNVERTVTLPAGKHNFLVKVVTGGFNLNWLKIEPILSSSTSSQSLSSSSNTSSSSAKSLTSSSLSTSSSTSSATSNIQTLITSVKGAVGLSWLAPNQRENGTYLDVTEVGGYEIRYKLADAPNFMYITIKDAWTTQYNFTWLEGDYIFQIAAFDKNGIYSNFVDIRPR